MADVTTVPSAASSLRDTILSALTSAGNADFVSLPGGLTLRLEASTTDPFVINVGGREYSFVADIDLTLTNTAHNFVFLDIAGTLSREAIPPIVSFTTPGAPASGQYWYDLGKRQMKRYDGATFVAVNRIFVAYARADGGAINARYLCAPIGIDPYQIWSRYGDGTDGFLDVSAGTTTIDGNKQYTFVAITSTGTLTHTTNTGPVLGVYSQFGIVFIGSAGFDANAKGGTGGAASTGVGNGGSGSGSGGAGGGGGGGTSAGGAGASTLFMGSSNSSSAGAAGGAGGGAGGTTTAEHYRAITIDLPVFQGRGNGGGSGGGDGSASGAGGAGGGTAGFKSPAIAIGASAFVRTNGANGANGPAANRGAGGGGGGGCIVLICRNYWNSGTFTATGGTGGTSGGAGSGAGGNGANGVAERRAV